MVGEGRDMRCGGSGFICVLGRRFLRVRARGWERFSREGRIDDVGGRF